MRLHLGESQYGVLTFPAMVVGLFTIMTAAWNCTVLGRGVLLEPGRHDAVEFLVLSSVCDDLVRVGTIIVALEAVEVAAALLVRTWNIQPYN